MAHYAVSTFYKFTRLADLPGLQQQLEAEGERLGIVGTILLAGEGINSTIAGLPDALEAFMRGLRRLEPFGELEEKRSGSDGPPFLRFKVRIKKEIVTLGVPDADPCRAVGTYVAPDDWDGLISDPGTILIDTRNDYEVGIGHFRGALNPGTHAFREFPRWVEEKLADQKDRTIAMYCTGGIRCEKATALLRNMGFKDVRHLKGGILKYLETVPEEKSLWEGSCFVFDERVAVGHGLAASGHQLCRSCRHPLGPDELRDPRYEEGVSCPHCADSLSERKKAGLRERQKQVEIANRRGTRHIGARTQILSKEDEP